MSNHVPSKFGIPTPLKYSDNWNPDKSTTISWSKRTHKQKQWRRHIVFQVHAKRTTLICQIMRRNTWIWHLKFEMRSHRVPQSTGQSQTRHM
jgi:hypothetical protein